MSKIEILPYEKGLLENFIYNGMEVSFSGEQIIPIVEFYSKIGSAYVAVCESKVLGVGGIYKLWQTTGGCFLFLNKEAQKYKKSLFKAMRLYMTKITKKYKIDTLTIECQDRKDKALSLVKHLGFRETKNIIMSVCVKNLKE